ncbi:Adenylate and Guanylate cyclase catalytic domain containing protein [Tritrichomonas foetus]|uniref:Adenylate and Guanylate cyclase catalytic domain containing protein n=1 Tax=Tritrichomonas foetus TaxID=1144522 RepID=A0A1J4K3C7_9EUKA|nr:Adenylate and Guanylate cyclase catalytic domain containing protein [Tritrichomonas foetus]|eukprot:OHT05482.1 Adenylate and Guanylate cyclase catalytic domain containing protein [Tritrichomonas foetus]
MNVESSAVQQSVMSTSSQVSANTQAQKLTSGNLYFFPIMDQISQTVHLSEFLVFIFQLWLFFQMIAVTFWVPMNPNLDNPQFLKDTKYITAVAFCYYDDGTQNSWIIPLIVYVILFVISLMFSVYEILYYKSHRKLIQWTLYPVRFFTEIIPLVLLHPIAALFGILIHSPSVDSLKIFSITVLSLLYVYFAVLMVITSTFLNMSAFLEKHAFATFDSGVYNTFVIISSLLCAFQYFVQYFPVWSIYFLVAIHIMGLIQTSFHAIYFPYISKISNILHLAIIMITGLLDILRVISIFVIFPDGIFQYIACAIVGISIILSIVAYIVIIKKAKNKLMYCFPHQPSENEEQMKNRLSDEEKVERFSSLNILTHRRRALFYLHVGLEYMSELFIDLSLFKWLSQNQPPTEILVDVIRICILFPGEYRLANMIMSQALQRRNLKMSHHCLLFQVLRIRILRQSSTSIQSSQKLSEMKNLNKSCENEVLSFFNRSDNINLGLLLHIYKKLSHTQSMWEEAMKSFPNSPVHREEYIRFLVECQTNFDSAIVQAHRKDLIETGVNFSVDYCFRSLARTYPQYLKMKVIDLKGHFMKQTARKGSQSQASDQSNQLSYTSTSDMDQKMEEKIGKTIITHARIRLALQNATQGKKANNSTRLVYFNFIVAIFSLTLFTVLFSLFFTYFEDMYSATERSKKVIKCRINYALANLCLLLDWTNNTNPKKMEISPADEEIWFSKESKDSGVIDPNYNYSKNAMFFNVISQEYYSEFLFDFASLARSGVNIFPIAVQVMEEVVPLTYCDKGDPIIVTNTTLRGALVFNLMFQVMLAAYQRDYDKYFTDNDFFCTLFATMPKIGDAFRDFRLNIVSSQVSDATSIKSTLNYMLILIPVAFIIIVFIPYLIITLLFNNEIKYFASLIMSVDKVHKDSAMQPIMKLDTEVKDVSNAEESSPTAYKAGLYLAMIFILSCGLMGFIIGIVYTVQTMNLQFQYVAVWSFKSSTRSPLAIEAMKCIYMVVLLDKIDTNITSQIFEKDSGNSQIKTIEEYRDSIMQGDSYAPSLIGFDPILTDFMISSTCEPNTENVILHDTYECGSINQLTIFFKDLFNNAQADVASFEGKLNSESLLNLYHLTLWHLIPRLQAVDDYFDEMVLNFQSSYKSQLIIMYVCSLAMTIALYIVAVAFNKLLDNAFNTALILLRRISPAGIIAKPKLVKYLLEISSDEKDTTMSISKSVFRNSQDGIFCIGLAGTIEVVNPAVSNILGYTPDQILGQSIAYVMDEESAEMIRTQLQLMVDRQSAPVYESHVVCVSDSDMRIECSLTILGITESNDQISSFVAVIRDEHELIKQQEEAEKAKAQSENLLYQILPRGIVVRLNQGEKDISFSVPIATISFIDIVKFSEYTVSMKPQEIMGTLSDLFGSYDEILSKYDLLVKIKLIGDVYMCAGGLFSPDEAPQNHAEQMIHFGLDALQQLDDTNIKMNTLLSVRIGVNSGGPLIAGVLGTDKPAFDIIGDPINVASRLQSTDIPGKIQISQACYDLIKDMDFNIEQRGEIYLKGKGQQMAYLVSPHTNAFQLTNT